MSIYLNQDSRIIVQGMTGGMGSKHTTLMLDAGRAILDELNHPLVTQVDTMDGAADKAAELAHQA